MLKEDHQAVERLFKRFEKAGDRAFAEKRRLADQIVEALSRHAAIEEQVFYPVARATVPGTEDVVLESLEEHHIVKWVLSELDGMDPAGERFEAKMTVLIENVRHHVEEEEHEFFPKVRAELDRKVLAELGRALEAAKELAPSHPHPRSPDTPPGNLAAAGGNGGPHQRHGEWCGAGQRDCRAGSGRVDPGPAEAVSGADGVEGGPRHGARRAGRGVEAHRRRHRGGGTGQGDGVDGCDRREEDRDDRGRCHEGHRPGRQEERKADHGDGASLGKANGLDSEAELGHPSADAPGPERRRRPRRRAAPPRRPRRRPADSLGLQAP